MLQFRSVTQAIGWLHTVSASQCGVVVNGRPYVWICAGNWKLIHVYWDRVPTNLKHMDS